MSNTSEHGRAAPAVHAEPAGPQKDRSPGRPASFVAPKDPKSIPAVHHPASGERMASPSTTAFADGEPAKGTVPWYCTPSGDCHQLHANARFVRIYQIHTGYEVPQVLSIVEKGKNRNDQVIVKGDDSRIYVYEADDLALAPNDARPLQVGDRFEFGAFSGRVAGVSDAWNEDLIRDALASDTTEDVAVGVGTVGALMVAPTFLETIPAALLVLADPLVLVGTILAGGALALFAGHFAVNESMREYEMFTNWDEEVESNASPDLLNASAGVTMAAEPYIGRATLGAPSEFVKPRRKNYGGLF